MRSTFLALALLAGAASAIQDQPAPAQRDQLTQLLHDAREGPPVVRPQAAQRLIALGEPARERLVAESETLRELAALGPDVVEVLGAFDDERLRGRLWSALGDADFPWRPAAARSLAGSAAGADEAEIERFVALLADPLSYVRVAALDGLAALDARGRKSLVRARLADPDDSVRRRAALLLDAWGEHDALAWLVEELRRDDTFFDSRLGRAARGEAIRALEERLGGRFGYEARLEPDDPANVAAIGQIVERCRALWGAVDPVLPPVARAAPSETAEAEAVLGLELRSCRRGELFLRWQRDDVLLVGTGNAARVELPEGTVARLVEAAKPLLAKLGDARTWGEPGCDVELLYWRPEPGARASVLRVSKGPDAVDGLRPDALGELVRALVATLPSGGEDPRVDDLAARTEDVLGALGGPLPE